MPDHKPSDDKLRIGIIGIGWYAAMNHVPQFRETGRAEIVAISRRNPERLALAKRELKIDQSYTDWREMLERAELDGVVICTPNNLHAEPTIAALNKGLHVLVEKPMALSSQDAQQMILAAEAAERVLMVGYNAHGMAGWMAAKQALNSGAIGQIRQISVTCCVDMRLLWQEVRLSDGVRNFTQSSELTSAFIGDILRTDHWHYDKSASGGGSLVDIGTHVMDLMLWLGGTRPSQVMAMAQPLGKGMASVVNAQARLANGSTLSLTFNDGVSGGDFNFYGHGRLTVFGDRGLLTADWTGFMVTEPDTIWIEHDGVGEKIEFEEKRVPPAAAFVATLLDGAPNVAPATQSAQTVALTEAIYRSIEGGKPIDVNAIG